MSDRPFWSDDFDLDLPKLVPGARGLLGDIADLSLVTHGHPDRRHGNLNHPCVWNEWVGDTASVVAFFGFRNSAKPVPNWTDAPPIRCTAWEAFRDCWPHNFVLMVEMKPVWDRPALSREFFDLAGAARGGRSGPEIEAARETVGGSIVLAAARLRCLASEHA